MSAPRQSSALEPVGRDEEVATPRCLRSESGFRSVVSHASEVHVK